MDLLADIGQADQLTSAREENRVLQSKVKELAVRVHELLAENQALKAEVEMYRTEFVNVGHHRNNTGEDSKEELMGVSKEEDDGNDFITCGNGVFPSDPAVMLPDINGAANPLCCSIHPDDSLLACGGANATLNLVKWGLALAPGEESSARAVNDAIKIPCGGPPICTAFAQVGNGKSFPVVAAGCMDGSVRLAYCGSDFDPSRSAEDRILLPVSVSNGINENGIKHSKYVKSVCWSPSEPVLASASADGTIQLTRVGSCGSLDGDNFTNKISMEVIQSVHFDSPVEAMCFLNDGDTLCCYVRDTCYLTYFDLKDGFKQTKYSLNGGCEFILLHHHVLSWAEMRSRILLYRPTKICAQLQELDVSMSMFLLQYSRFNHPQMVANILHWRLICHAILSLRPVLIKSLEICMATRMMGFRIQRLHGASTAR